MGYYIQTCFNKEGEVGYQIVRIGQEGVVEETYGTYKNLDNAIKVLDKWGVTHIQTSFPLGTE
jgi:hypothetical protein